MLPTPFPVDPRLAGLLDGRRAWISGARGFIGSRLVVALKSHGALPSVFEGDVRNGREITASVLDTTPDLLWNLAARVDVTRDSALEPVMKATSLEGVRHLLEAMDNLDSVPLLVQCGTCEEYGTIPAPFSEDDTPSEPVSPYAKYKLEATREVLQAARTGRCRAVVARPFLTYGPGQDTQALVPSAVRAALRGEPFEMTSGRQTRELNFVDDTVLGLLRCAASPRAEGLVVNVAGGDERPVREIVQEVFRLAGAPQSLIRLGARPDRPGEVPRFFADTSRCRELLGHFPRVSLEQGLQQTISAWQDDSEDPPKP